MNSKVSRLLTILRSKGYKIFTRPFELNIIAERSASVRSETFDDRLHVLFRDNMNRWLHHEYEVTTDPSTYYIDNPVVPQGYGFIKKGQYVNAYRKGYHKGRPALEQVRPITVVRNYDVKGIFRSITGQEQSGLFGNNIHDMKGSMFNASAGCIVFSRDHEYQEFLRLVSGHAGIYKNAFTLTLIDFRDRNKVRNTSIAAASLIGAGMLTIGFRKKLI